MNYLKSLILDQEIIKDKVELEAFFEKNKISDSVLIHKVILDKKTFTDEVQARDWLESHGFYDCKIEEYDKTFIFLNFDEFNFDTKTLAKIELREGVMLEVGELRPVSESPYHLSLGNEKNIKLSGTLPSVIEIAKVVDGVHPQFGKVEIDKKMLKGFIKNFDNKVAGIDISIDYDHETREAAGWLKSLFLSVDEKTLLGEIKWTPKGALALSDKEFRYFSPEYSLNFVHPHTGKSFGATLLGGALVNRPFLKMEAIVELKDKTINEVIMDTINLKDHEAKVAEKDKVIAELKLSENEAKKAIDGFKSENEELKKENVTLKEEKAKAETEEKHNKLFSEGKINKAQLTALNEGKELIEVLSLSEKLNTDAKGKDGENKDLISLSEKEQAVCKSLGLTNEEFIKYNK